MLLAAARWWDAGSPTVKTVLALGTVALIVAGVAGVFLMVFGYIQCRMVAVRRTVNHRAVRGLLGVLLGWLVVYAGVGLSLTSVYRIWVWPALGLAAVIFAVGATLGWLGLRQIRREPRHFNYGLGHGKAAVLAGGIPLLLMGLIFVGAMTVYGWDLSGIRMMMRGHYVSPNFGYQVKLEGRVWKAWPRMAERMSGAEFGVVSLFEDCGLFVVPVWLGGRQADMGAVVEALLAEVGLAPGHAKLETVPLPPGALEDERHFRLFRTEEGGGVWYRFRVAVSGGAAYLVSAWVDQRQGASNERLDEDVMRVALGGGAGQAPTAAGAGSAAAARQGRIIRRIAAYLEKHGRVQDSGGWLADARGWDGGAATIGVAASSVVDQALFFLDVGCAREALAAVEPVLLAQPANALGIAVKAVALGRLGRLKEAKAAIAVAPKILSDNASLAGAKACLRMIERGASVAEAGEMAEVVSVPAGLLQSKAEGVATSPATGIDGEWSVTAVRFRKGEPFVLSRYSRVRVVAADGAKTLKSVWEEFDPGQETLSVNRASILDPAGKEVGQIDVKAWRQVGAAVDGRVRVEAALPELKPGQAIDWVVTVRHFLPSARFPFLAHCFSRPWPVRRSVLWLDGDFQALSASNTPGVGRPTREPKPHWIVENPPAKPTDEPFLPADPSYLPTVWVGEGAESWAQLGGAYLEVAGGRLAAGEWVRTLGKAAGEATPDVGQRVGGLVRAMRGRVRMMPGEYRSGDRVPAAAEESVQRGAADGKGQAGLLQALLAAEGIESSLALVAADGFVQQGLPSLEQFNRVLVFVPKLMPHQFVDCGSTDVDPQLGLPASVAGRKALLLDPASPRLVEVSTRLMAGIIEIAREARRQPDGAIALKETARFLGPAKALARGWFLDGGRFGPEAALREAKGVESVAATLRDETDFGKPLVVEVTGVARARPGGARAVAMIETALLHQGECGGRRAPAWLGAPLQVRGRLDAGVPLEKPGNVETASLGCTFEAGEGFGYVIKRAAGLMAPDVFRQMAADAQRIVAAIEPPLGGAAGGAAVP